MMHLMPFGNFGRLTNEAVYGISWYLVTKSLLIFIILDYNNIVLMGVDGSWWVPRTSNPMWGGSAVLGGFDSHTLPPKLTRKGEPS